MAREKGQAPHSPELSGAAGLLAAAFALSVWGESIAEALMAVLRLPLQGATVSVDAVEVVHSVRQAVAAVAVPVLSVIVASAAGVIAAHQAQVRGLFTPGLLAPDPTRLWALGQGGDLGARAVRGMWSLAKAAVVVAVAAWCLKAGWGEFSALGSLPTTEFARACGGAVSRLCLRLAGATVALGLVDFALVWFRYESMLRVTPDEQREDMKSMDGDPALRAQRRRIARSWRNDPAELLTGATLMLTGPSGLAVVLGGGPPPRKMNVRAALNGADGERLRAAAAASNLPRRDAPDLALRLARRRPPGVALTGDLMKEIGEIWGD